MDFVKNLKKVDLIIICIVSALLISLTFMFPSDVRTLIGGLIIASYFAFILCHLMICIPLTLIWIIIENFVLDSKLGKKVKKASTILYFILGIVSMVISCYIIYYGVPVIGIAMFENVSLTEAAIIFNSKFAK